MKNKKIYFIGIGGIGMSALAQYFMQNQYDVFGYDLTPSPITEMLIQKGANIHYQPDVNSIPNDIDFVVYTPAIHSEFSEFQYFIQKNIPMFKRSQVLGMITDEFFTIAVAGTHGKTTTTSMTSHLFHKGTDTFLAFIGGISKNLNDNYCYDIIKDYAHKIAVVEADEFDRSFLTLHPNIAIITSMDADHLDIYENETKLYDAFQQFANQSENLIIEENVSKFIAKKNKYIYGFSKSCDCYPYNIRHGENFTKFDLHTPFVELNNLKTTLRGDYNILNTVASIFAFILEKRITSNTNLDSIDLDIQEVVSQKTFSFLGVKRRFEYIVKNDDFVFIDDYAHHPQEMSSFFSAVRQLYPDKKITGIFQPHLFSRTRDFADEFARALELLNKVILLPIYPAREAPIEGINSEFLLKKVNVEDKIFLQKDELIKYLRENKSEILLTVGAGDIDRLVPIIAQNVVC